MRVADAVECLVAWLGDAVEKSRADDDDGFIAARFGDRSLTVDVYFDESMIANVSTYDDERLVGFGSWRVLNVDGLIALVSAELSKAGVTDVLH